PKCFPPWEVNEVVPITFEKMEDGEIIAIADPPFQVLASFLIVESLSWTCRDLPHILEEIRNDESDEYVESGNAHILSVGKDDVSIEKEYGPDPKTCSMSFEDFIWVINQWCNLHK